MKNKAHLLILFFCLITLPIQAQNQNATFKQMKEAFSASDYTKLSALFSDSVDLTVRNTDGIYSKTQAKGVLKSFFEQLK